MRTLDTQSLELLASSSASSHLNKKKLFKSYFSKTLNDHFKKIIYVATGDIGISSSWKDWLGMAGISLSVSSITGTVTLLATVGIISNIASSAIALPFTILGIVGGLGFAVYRNSKKKNEFLNATQILLSNDLLASIQIITDNLYQLNKSNIYHFTVNDIRKFSNACASTISYILMKGKIKEINELYHPGCLQFYLARSINSYKKGTIITEINDNKKRNIKGYITKPGLYCFQNDRFYSSSHSRLEKYGVLLFQKQEELKEYTELEKKNQIYYLLNKEQSVAIIRNSLFFKNKISKNKRINQLPQLKMT